MTRRSSKPPAAFASPAPRPALPYDTLGMDAESLKRGILAHLEFTLAELPRHVDTEWEPYVALALAVRDRMIQRWLHTQDTYYERDVKRSEERRVGKECRARRWPWRENESEGSGEEKHGA